MAFVKKTRSMTSTQEKACNEIAASFSSSSSSSPSTSSKTVVRSKPCFHMDACVLKSQGKCNFAHSIDELNPMVCMFDRKCKKDDCLRFHPSFQTKEQYCETNGFVFQNTANIATENNKNNENKFVFFDPYEVMDEIEEVMDEIEFENDQQFWEDMADIEFINFMNAVESRNPDEIMEEKHNEFEQELHILDHPFSETCYEEHIY